MSNSINNTGLSSNLSMAAIYKSVAIMTFIILSFGQAKAQEMVNQNGRVREIRYSSQDTIVPIKDVLITLKGGVKKRSHADGTFQLPVTKFSPFNIEMIEPPIQNIYSLVLPSRSEFRNSYIYSPNIFEIIFSNEEKRRIEENRIAENIELSYNDQISVLNQQIRRLQIKLEHSLSESESAKRTLKNQIDSLSNILSAYQRDFTPTNIKKLVEQLVAIDYDKLAPEDAQITDLKKNGDWATLREFARENLASDEYLDSLENENKEIMAVMIDGTNKIAQNTAELKKNIQRFRDMFDAYANMHQRDSAVYFINKIFSHPNYTTLNDYITYSNYINKQIGDSKKAAGILSDGIKKYNESQDLDSEIRLILYLAELEFESGKIHEASKMFADVEEKLMLPDLYTAQTLWYAKNKIGTFCIAVGDIKKGIELMQYCKSSLQDNDIADLDTYEFLSDYVSALISIGQYNEADETVDFILSRLEALRTNIYYKEIYAYAIVEKANIQFAKGLIKESTDNCNLAISIYNDIYSKASKAEVSPRMMLAAYQFSSGRFNEANESLDFIEGIIAASYDDPEAPMTQVQLKRAENLFTLAKFNEAEEIYLNQIKVLDKYFAKQPINATKAYLGLSKIYSSRGDYQKALKILTDCDSIVQKTFPQDGTHRISTLSGIADVKFATQNYDEAISILEKAKKIATGMAGDQSSTYDNISVTLASFKRQMGFYDEAKALLADVHRNRESLPEDMAAMPCAFKLEEISLMSASANYDEMKSAIDAVLAEATSVFGEAHPTTINIRSYLATYYENVGEIEKAIETYENCIALTQQHFPGIDILVAGYFRSLSELFRYLGNLEKTKYYANKAYEICRNIYGNENVNTIQAKFNAILLDSDNYDYISKISALDQIANELDKAGATNSMVRNSVLCQKASLLNDNGYYNSALELYKEILQTSSNAFGKRHPNNNVILMGLALCYSNLLNYKESNRLYEEALSIALETYGENNIYYGNVVSRYAEFLTNNGQYSEALKFADEAYIINERSNSKLAQVYTMQLLSSIHGGKEDYNKALHYLDSALALHLSIYNKENFQTIDIYERYALLYSNCNEFDKSLENYDRALNLANLFFAPDDDKVLSITIGKILMLINAFKTDEALLLAENVLEKLTKISNGNTLLDIKRLLTYMTLAEVYKAMGENKKAIEILERLYAHIDDKSGYERVAAQIKYAISCNEYDMMNHMSALENIISAENFALKSDSEALLRNIRRGHAEILTVLGRFDEAYVILEDYANEILNAPQDLNRSSASMCHALYSLYSLKQEKRNAIRFNEILKEYYKKTMGESSPHYITMSLQSIINGETYESYATNLERIKTFLNTLDSVCGVESRISKNWHFQTALYRFKQEGSVSADKNLRKRYEVLEQLRVLPEQLCLVCVMMASAYQSLGNLEDAKGYLNKAKQIVNEISTINPYLYNSVKLPFIKCMITLGDFNEAETNLNECKEFLTSKYGDNSPLLLPLLETEMSLYLNRFEQSENTNDPQKAENTIHRYENILNLLTTDFPTNESQINYNKGLLYVKKGMPTLAEIYFDKYKNYVIEHYGDDCYQLFVYYKFQAGRMLQEAFVSQDFNKLAEVEKLINKSLEISKNLGSDAPLNIESYQLLASVKMFKFVQSQDNSFLDDAMNLLDKCLTIVDKYVGDSPIKYGILSSKQQVCLLYKDFDTTEDILNSLYDMAKKIWGEESYNLYSIKCGFANLSMMKEEYDNAVEIYHDVLEFLYKQNSYEAEKINLLNIYANALGSSGKFEDAKIQLKRALKLIDDSDNPNLYNNIRGTIQESIDSF